MTNMSMSDATSNPADWSQLFSRATDGGRSGHPLLPFTEASVAAESTIVTTKPVTPTHILHPAGGASHAAGAVEGRVGKSARKRPRASRRAPTMLLNTDTANFRAMVQQFTGVPTGPYAAPGQSNINFSVGFENPVGQPTTLPFSRAINLRHQHQYNNQYQYQHHQQEVIGFDDEDLLHMENPRSGGLGTSEGYFLEGMGARGPTAPAAAAAMDDRDVGYFL